MKHSATAQWTIAVHVLQDCDDAKEFHRSVSKCLLVPPSILQHTSKYSSCIVSPLPICMVGVYFYHKNDAIYSCYIQNYWQTKTYTFTQTQPYLTLFCFIVNCLFFFFKESQHILRVHYFIVLESWCSISHDDFTTITWPLS